MFAVATLVCAAMSSIACGGSHASLRESAGERAPLNPLEQCRASFAACAPSVNFDETTDVSKLSARGLVSLAGRLDRPEKLAASAAKRLRKIALAAQTPQLLELEAELDVAATVLERCRCAGGFRSPLEEQGIAELVSSRLPSREQRSPDLWAGRMLAELAAIQKLSWRSAMLTAGQSAEGDAAPGNDETRLADARRRLCEVVHGARALLSPEAFATAREIVYKRRSAEAGDGSAEAARTMIAEHEGSTSCTSP